MIKDKFIKLRNIYLPPFWTNSTFYCGTSIYFHSELAFSSIWNIPYWFNKSFCSTRTPGVSSFKLEFLECPIRKHCQKISPSDENHWKSDRWYEILSLWLLWMEFYMPNVTGHQFWGVLWWRWYSQQASVGSRTLAVLWS